MVELDANELDANTSESGSPDGGFFLDRTLDTNSSAIDAARDVASADSRNQDERAHDADVAVDTSDVRGSDVLDAQLRADASVRDGASADAVTADASAARGPRRGWYQVWPVPRYQAFAVSTPSGFLMGGGASRQGWPIGDELFLFDGDRFIDRSSSLNAGGDLNRAAAVYDPDRDRVVIFGGGFPARAETLEGPPNGVITALAASGPAARTGLAMAYDEARDQIVLFGGLLAGNTLVRDTWIFERGAWTRVTPDHSPSARQGHAMAFDANLQRVILYGGMDLAQANGELWSWTGTDWERMTDASPRAWHAMTYDPTRDSLVVVGGTTNQLDGLGSVRRTESGTWTAVAGHPATFGSVLARANGNLYSFGGSVESLDSGALYVLREGATAWELDGLATPALSSHAMAYDSLRRRTVLFGGSGRLGASSATWEWDGRRWRQMASSGPAARSSAAMAYDPARNRTVLFGGTPSPDDDEVWEWDGVTWRRFDPSTGLRNRFDHAMVYDREAGGVLLVGGQRGASFERTVWVWDGATWSSIGTSPDMGGDLNATRDPSDQSVLFCGGGAPGINTTLRKYRDNVWSTLDHPWTVCSGPSDRIAFVEGREDILVWAAFDGASAYLPRSRCFSKCTTGLWTSLAPAVSPPPRRFAAMSSAPGGALLTGGRHVGGSSPFGDAWGFGE